MGKTLNVGCGERTFEEYPAGNTCINFDFRADLPGVDIVGNVQDLSQFEDGEFDYILASDIIEHFTIKEVPFILEEFYRVLTRYGIVEFRTPNLAWVAKHYMENRDAKFISYHVFGGQDYEGNFHKVIFDRYWLMSLCIERGFIEESYEEEGSNFILKVRKV